MINILIPAMGKSEFFKDYYFPKLLFEISGKTMIEKVIDDYSELESKQFIFVFSDEDCKRFHLDKSIKILYPSSKVIRLHSQTAGALCTSLMSIDYINNDNPLIIANCDQIIEIDYQDVLDRFNLNNVDAGVITFPSIHPRWSYAKLDGDYVVEVAEKRPFSKNAIAGFYYYRQGKLFVEAAKNAIIKQNSIDGNYYLSSSMNELILLGKKVGFYEIAKDEYKSFYSPAKIKEYEDSLK